MLHITIPATQEPCTECLVSPYVKEQILSTPGYPQALLPLQPQLSLDLGSDGKGVYAKQVFHPGDIILNERPLTITSVVAPRVPVKDGTTEAECKQLVFAEGERIMQTVFERMTPERQRAYMALPNIHNDGCGPLTGIMRTNGFGVYGRVQEECT